MPHRKISSESFATFALGEYTIGISTDPLTQSYPLGTVAGKYLTLLNSFIPAGSYILPGGDENTRVPIFPKVSYLVESVNTLIITINRVGRLTNANITITSLESSPIIFAWSDKPIFTQTPIGASSIESFVTGAAHPAVDGINGRINDIDLNTTFLSLYPLVGIPAYNFAIKVIPGDPSPVNDNWLSLQFNHLMQGESSIFPLAAQMISAEQAAATQSLYDSIIVLRAESSYNVIPRGFGGVTNSDSFMFNLSPTNQFPPTQPGNVAFTFDVTLNTTDTEHINVPANFFCETIIISADNTAGGTSTVAEQFILAGGGTVDNVIATLASGATESLTQINRMISETLELVLDANVGSNTEFLIEIRGQIVN